MELCKKAVVRRIGLGSALLLTGGLLSVAFGGGYVNCPYNRCEEAKWVFHSPKAANKCYKWDNVHASFLWGVHSGPDESPTGTGFYHYKYDCDVCLQVCDDDYPHSSKAFTETTCVSPILVERTICPAIPS
jgi:hypothetical protein